jgi:hypothetical protein
MPWNTIFMTLNTLLVVAIVVVFCEKTSLDFWPSCWRCVLTVGDGFASGCSWNKATSSSYGWPGRVSSSSPFFLGGSSHITWVLPWLQLLFTVQLITKSVLFNACYCCMIWWCYWLYFCEIASLFIYWINEMLTTKHVTCNYIVNG